MSKMTMPRVEVVRFQESDVIVASGDILKLSGFADGAPQTATMTFRGTPYTNEGADNSASAGNALNAALTRAGYGNIVDATRVSENSLDGSVQNLFESDFGGDNLLHAADGDYHWDGFMWRQ